jgi:hypothetical protein
MLEESGTGGGSAGAGGDSTGTEGGSAEMRKRSIGNPFLPRQNGATTPFNAVLMFTMAALPVIL